MHTYFVCPISPCLLAPALHVCLDLYPCSNIIHVHSSGPFGLSFCLLFLLLLSRLLEAPPNRFALGTQKLTSAVQMLYKGIVQWFFFPLKGLDAYSVSLLILFNSTAQAKC